jgi:hypothetical protein
MSVYIDKKYIALLAPKLSQFKQRGEFLWNFRCPVCGDSQKNKIKTRGYIYKRKERFGFMCHNCHSTMGLGKFIRYVDPALYNEYQLESFVKSNTSNNVNVADFATKPVFNIPAAPRSILLTDAKSINGLSQYHPARIYLENRKVPLDNLYYTEDFAKFVKDLFPQVDKQLYKEERIVLPFYDKEGNLLGVQGRAIGQSKIKYITIKDNEDTPKIFGWDGLDTSKTVYVVEGPIDSLFLNNSVATMDAALYTAPNTIGLDYNYTFVYDNEPRNKQIVTNMRKTIDMGKKICVWPDTIQQKDINDMVISGMHPSEIQHIIDSNTFEGLIATMKMNQWSRV